MTIQFFNLNRVSLRRLNLASSKLFGQARVSVLRRLRFWHPRLQPLTTYLQVGVMLVLASVSLSGCLTYGAVQDLKSANDLLDVSVRRSADSGNTAQVTWQATFGKRPNFPDDLVTPYLHRALSTQGTAPWPRVGGRYCSALQIGRELVSAAKFVSVTNPAAIPEFGTTSDQSVCRVGLSRLVEGQGVATLLVDSPRDSDGSSVAIAVIPNERPRADLRRWGWLAVSPILDVASLLVIPPILLAWEVSNYFGAGDAPAAE